ncbi:MAG: TspO/MBR family protein [Beijerinckiaceae bacterium]
MASSISERIGDQRGSVWLLALLAVAPVIAASYVGSSVTTPNLAPWYAALTKPWFTPANSVFAPVWAALYALMAYAAWRILHQRPQAAWRSEALVLFYGQLAVNCTWSIAFFGMRSPGLGVAVIVLLFALIAITMTIFAQVDKIACWLLAPYLLWVGFAMLLNVEIWRLN